MNIKELAKELEEILETHPVISSVHMRITEILRLIDGAEEQHIWRGTKKREDDERCICTQRTHPPCERCQTGTILFFSAKPPTLKEAVRTYINRAYDAPAHNVDHIAAFKDLTAALEREDS